MPGRNGTGPRSMGPLTGRGLGPCGRGMAWGRGCGRYGGGRGFGGNWGVSYTPEQEEQYLRQEMEMMQARLAELQARQGNVSGQ